MNLLTGSPKQIALGMKLRAELLAKWKKANPESFKKVESILTDETSATWWIGNKDKGIDGILQVLRKQTSGRKCNSSSPVSISICPIDVKKTYVTCAIGIHRYVGELRDIVTGEVVVDLDCPF